MERVFEFKVSLWQSNQLLFYAMALLNILHVENSFFFLKISIHKQLLVLILPKASGSLFAHFCMFVDSYDHHGTNFFCSLLLSKYKFEWCGFRCIKEIKLQTSLSGSYISNLMGVWQAKNIVIRRFFHNCWHLSSVSQYLLMY